MQLSKYSFYSYNIVNIYLNVLNLILESDKSKHFNVLEEGPSAKILTGKFFPTKVLAIKNDVDYMRDFLPN